MTPADLQGATFGPRHVAVTADRIVEFVVATGDDPERWSEVAPPAFAAALLFAVAGDFLWDQRIVEHTRTLLHVDQEFGFHAVIGAGEAVEVAGTVTRVRERSGSYFVTFQAEAAVPSGPVLQSTSTFLMSARSGGDPGRDDGEPPAAAKAVDQRPTVGGDDRGRLLKSASRADLVRYAAATKDFNPIHWDHDSARAAGATGTIVHGLLMMAWALQGAASVGPVTAPLAFAKVRFRHPLRPGEQATVSWRPGTEETGEARPVSLLVARGDQELVTGTATVRPDRG